MARMHHVSLDDPDKDRPNALGSALLSATCTQLEHAARQLARPGQARHEGIHQARKSLRRARAILALGQRKLGAQAVALDAQIGRLGRGLSALRDAHALVETLQRLQLDEPGLSEVLPAAIIAASARRDAMLQAALQRDPELASRQRRIAVMLRQAQKLNWRTIRERTVTKALARSEARIDRARRQAEAQPHDHAAWHRLRRRIRRLRQQHTVLEELAPQLCQHLPPTDDRAEALSLSQDDALLLARCTTRSPFTAEHRVLLRAVARRRLAQVRLPTPAKR